MVGRWTVHPRLGELASEGADVWMTDEEASDETSLAKRRRRRRSRKMSGR